MKRILSLSTLLLIAIVSVMAQNNKPAITFDTTSHDFGNFDESIGKVTTEFKFTNSGKAPLLITRTAASCGCTTPEYPKEPIAPGKSGTIKVTYNAKGRPGVFQKTIYVMSNAEPEKSTLIIKGKVIPTPPKKEDAYAKTIGDVRLKRTHVPFFDVYPDSPKTEVIDIINPTDETVTLVFTEVPKHLRVVAKPLKLAPKAEGVIEITYYPEKAKDWGLRKDLFRVGMAGKKLNPEESKITLSADIREDFGKLSKKQLENAPVQVLSTKMLDFGKISEKTTHEITIRNTGKSDLIIRKIKNENEAIDVDVNRKTIQPGKTGTIKVTVLTNKVRNRNLSQNIMLITNAPESPTTLLKIKATVN
ncbi:MAG: DUF1573 domain-containing protein [Bacteroidales bacterium]